jgi:periplasmic divalent cation tolerance protein
MKVLIVLCNVPDETLAQHMAAVLVAESLAACVNILPACQSVYRWEGRIESACEIPLLIKTTTAQYAGLQARIQELHPYDVPEILALAAENGLPAYLAWVQASVVGA